MHSIFISYSNKDKLTADALCAKLEAEHIRCWIAPRDIIAGQNYAGQITSAIRRSKIFILVLSGNSNLSPHVLKEVELAVTTGSTIIPLRIEDINLSDDLQYYLGNVHWLDALTPPLETHLQTLIISVKSLLYPETEAGTINEENYENVPPLPKLTPHRPLKNKETNKNNYPLAQRKLTIFWKGVIILFMLLGIFLASFIIKKLTQLDAEPNSLQGQENFVLNQLVAETTSFQETETITLKKYETYKYENPPIPYGIFSSGTDKWIYFISDVFGNYDIFRMSLNDDKIENISNTPFISEAQFDVTPSGRQIVFEALVNQNLQLFVMNSDGSEKKQITFSENYNNAVPNWSPDEEMICFFSDRNGSRDIFLINRFGLLETELTSGKDNDTNCNWSPDGSQIVFDRNNDESIYIMNSDGSNLHLLSNGRHPAWSPLGNRIVFGEGSQMFLIDPDGSNLTLLASFFDGEYGHYPENFDWSSDGKLITFQAARSGSGGNYVKDYEIHVISIEDGKVTWLTNNSIGDGGPVFSP